MYLYGLPKMQFGWNHVDLKSNTAVGQMTEGGDREDTIPGSHKVIFFQGMLILMNADGYYGTGRDNWRGMVPKIASP